MTITHESNKSKAGNGNQYTKDLYLKIRRQNHHYKISKLNREKKFYYDEKTIEEKIADEVILELTSKGKKVTATAVKNLCKKKMQDFLDENKDTVIRDSQKFYKRADITFLTDNTYEVNGKKKKLRVIVDTTTSARGDRIKAKAQDAYVYESFKMPYLYLIVLPDDDYFTTTGFANPKNEINNCKNAIYKANFCNEYSKENVSLILQEKDLVSFLEYISKRKDKNIDELVRRWKNLHYKDMKEKREGEIKYYKSQVASRASKRVFERLGA